MTTRVVRPRSLKPAIVERVNRAIVRLPRLGGRGVLIPNGFVATAAHCIGWTAEGYMALGDYYAEEIMTADGRAIKVQPVSLDPICDLAFLGAVDDQASEEFGRAADAFERFCEMTKPVRLLTDDLRVGEPMAAYVFTHNKGVIAARVTQWGVGSDGSRLHLHAETAIDGGTSGSPVVTDDGRLVGIVSNSGTYTGSSTCDGLMPRIYLAAPNWLARRMVVRR